MDGWMNGWMNVISRKGKVHYALMLYVKNTQIKFHCDCRIDNGYKNHHRDQCYKNMIIHQFARSIHNERTFQMKTISFVQNLSLPEVVSKNEWVFANMIKYKNM